MGLPPRTYKQLQESRAERFDMTREDIVVLAGLAAVVCWIYIAVPLLYRVA